jgi:hypothetical protein
MFFLLLLMFSLQQNWRTRGREEEFGVCRIGWGKGVVGRGER